MAPSFLLTAIYFLRAVTWMLAMVILGLLGTAIEVLTFPVFYFLDPTLRVYQYLVCLIAQASLYPVISVKVHVRFVGGGGRQAPLSPCRGPCSSPQP